MLFRGDSHACPRGRGGVRQWRISRSQPSLQSLQSIPFQVRGGVLGGTRCCVCAAVGENSFARLPFLKIGGNHRPAQLAATRHLHSSHIRKLQHIQQCRGECALASAPTTCACTQSSNNGRVRPDSGFPRIPPSSASCSAFLGHDNVISRASTASAPSNMKSFFFLVPGRTSPP